LFAILRREQKRHPRRIETFFSSRRSPQERIDRLSADVAKHRGGRRDSAQFQAVKARLR
jgi:hypothetical protein